MKRMFNNETGPTHMRLANALAILPVIAARAQKVLK